jgi:hypothetical protein
MTANPPDTPPQPATVPQTAPPGAVQTAPKTSGHAVASLILGIVGPCTVGLASIAGLILGIVGLSKIKKSAGVIRGQGLAIAGIILSALGVLMLLLSPILVAILLPAIATARGQARAVMCMNNLRQITMAAHAYAADRDNSLPPPDSWPEKLLPYIGSEDLLNDPSDTAAGRAVAMNAALDDMHLDAVRDASRTVMFFACAPGAPPAGGPELLPPEPRYRGGHIIAFCDGTVDRVPPDELDHLIWDPRK